MAGKNPTIQIQIHPEVYSGSSLKSIYFFSENKNDKISLMEIKEGIEPSLKQRELNSLKNVRDKIAQHGHRLSAAYHDRSIESFYEIAKDVGFNPQEVPLGTSFVNARGQNDLLTRENSVRIGQGNRLFVGTEHERVFSLDDLAHDVGACVLGGKLTGPDRVGLIHAATLNEVAWRSIRKTYTYQELLDLQVIKEGKQGDLRVAPTFLLDAIVYQKTFPFKAIKYV